MSQLTSQPLSAVSQFNYIFLINILVVGILALFFLFYFNRLFGTLVSYGVRAYTWNKYRTYLDITALQISLLGGRIFFKSVRYHAHNITIFVHDGNITWRYWLRLVRDPEILFERPEELPQTRLATPLSDSGNEGQSSPSEKSRVRGINIDKEEKASSKPKRELPCRIFVKVSAVEAFIYNHSPAYDNIVEATLKAARKKSEQDGTRSDSQSASSGFDDKETPAQQSSNMDARSTAATSTATIQKPDIPSFLKVFPISIECKRAAAAIGNDNTTNVLTAKVERATGTINAGEAGPLDLYKLLFDFDFEKIAVALKPNRDFKEKQLDTAKRTLAGMGYKVPRTGERIAKAAHKVKSSWWKVWARVHDSHSSTASLRTASMKSVVDHISRGSQDDATTPSHWHGLTRYLEDDAEENHNQWEKIEYAKATSLVECARVTMHFYWDIGGPVPEGLTDTDTLNGSVYEGDMNGSKPPEYGIDLGVHGATVVYGPWADRQRINIQQVFFPALCVDATPSQPLKPGETRVTTVLKLAVVVEEDVVLRIPTREGSKDEDWRGRVSSAFGMNDHDGRPDKSTEKSTKNRKRDKRRKKDKRPDTTDQRPYGWLDITVKKDSVIDYTMDMYPRVNGYRNQLHVNVKGVEMSSSVNHGLLWRSGAVSVDADLSYPVCWNSIRKWPFKVICDDLELFILRDHLFLIIDLVDDWASGPLPDFYTFVPFNYQLDLTFNNFAMYLNVNDANIINDPADLDKNDYLTLEGQLHSVLGIPMEYYRPKRNQISFDVLAQDMQMRLLSPAKNTLSFFLQEKKVASLPKLTLTGSFNANQGTEPGLTDVLRMDIVGTGLTLHAYGFYIRQLMNVKENYFGDFMHFKTLEEFQHAGDNVSEANARTATIAKPQSANELDVILCIVAEEVSIIIPTNLYSAKDFIRAELPRADLDLRITSYYLDMGLSLSPLSIMASPGIRDDASTESETESTTQLFLYSVDLSGHRAFGPPPNETAYISEWDIDVGKIVGELSTAFVHKLALAARAFSHSISDAENALPLPSPDVLREAAFVRVRTSTVSLWLHVGGEALLMAADPISVDVNGWASELFSQRVSVLVPRITISCIDARTAIRQQSRRARKVVVPTYAFFQTGVMLDVIERKHNFADETQLQYDNIQQNDQRTNRAPFLHRNGDGRLPEQLKVDCSPPAMPFPMLPPPLPKKWLTASKPTSIRSIKTHLETYSQHSASVTSLSDSLRDGVTKTKTGRPILPQPQFSSMNSTSAQSRSSGSSTPTFRRGVPDGSTPSHIRGVTGTLASSSSYSVPYFPLEMTHPDESNVPPFLEQRHLESFHSDSSSISGSINDPDIDADAGHTTVFISMVPGVRAYVDPRVVAVASDLLRELIPVRPDEVMDAYHIEVMSAIQEEQAKGNVKQKNILEIQASLPNTSLRVINFHQDLPKDQIDLKLGLIEMSLRTRTQPLEAGMLQVLALHSSLNNLDFSVREYAASRRTNAAVQITIDDVLVWLNLSSARVFQISVKDTHADIIEEQTDYLSRLTLRVLPLVERFKTAFEGIQESREQRLRLLIDALMHNSEGIGEPPFLHRMIYLLRAFPNHLRNQDAWKILVRFRYIFHRLSADAIQTLDKSLRIARSALPEDAAVQALERWTQTRNWDVPYVSQTIAFKKIFDPEAAIRTEPGKAHALSVVFRSEDFRFSVIHRSTVSEIILQETSVGVESVPPATPEGLMLVEENKRTKTTIQAYTNSIAFSLEWALVGMIHTVLKRKDAFTKGAAPLLPQDPQTPIQAYEEGLWRHDFHIVFSTESGQISLRTENLHHIMTANGLRMSLIGTTQAPDPDLGQCTSAMINCDNATTELYGRTRQLMKTLLTLPSVYLDDLRSRPGSDRAPTITIALAHQDLIVKVKEQLPGILNIVDSVLADEVTAVKDIVRMATEGKPPSDAIGLAALNVKQETTTPTRLHIAILAGQLKLQISLLQNLKYQLQGKAISLRVAPSFQDYKLLTLDFDIGQINHAFINTSAKSAHTQGIVDVPPINGHIGLHFDKEQTCLSVATTVQRIEVDAGAIQGVLGVINRPEVQEVILAVKNGVEDVQAHVLEIFPAQPVEKQKQSNGTKPLVYDGRISLEGVRVSASTPQIAGHSTAEIEFGIGPLHAIASNKKALKSNFPLIPEVRARILDIGAALKIQTQDEVRHCGNLLFGISMHFNPTSQPDGSLAQELGMQSKGLEINAYPETAAAIVDVINHLQDRIKDLDVSKELDYLRRLRDSKGTRARQTRTTSVGDLQELPFSPEDLLSITTTIQLTDIQVCWLVDPSLASQPRNQTEDLIFSIENVLFTTRGGHEARLTIQEMQLQLTPKSERKNYRAPNSALLPEVSFSVGYWSQDRHRALAFKATGKPLDVQLDTKFLIPVDALKRSIELATKQFKTGTATWQSTPTSTGAPRGRVFDTKSVRSLLVEADFAGAQVHIKSSTVEDRSFRSPAPNAGSNRDGQSEGEQYRARDRRAQTSLTSPGIAFKLEYNSVQHHPVVRGELRIDASENMLRPNVVPLILEISHSVKELMKEQDDIPTIKEPTPETNAPQKFFEDDSLMTVDPTAIFGKSKVDLGIRICKQRFGLTCQPIARVDAEASMDDLYFTISTIDSEEHGHFFAISAVMTQLTAQVKHMYSREPTFRYDIESVVLSAINDKHLSGTAGISAIININPTRIVINGKQFQDVLLFQEIWVPPEIRNAVPASSTTTEPSSSARPEEYFAQKYQTVAAAAAFPWNATVSIVDLNVELDLGQSIGKSSFKVKNLWASQQKSSNWEQNLCAGLDELSMDSTGRMSGYILLAELKARTSIQWPEINSDAIARKTPLIQASIGFSRLRAKAAFDYQAFALADIEGLDFLMYNVREKSRAADRLVAVLDCDKAYILCTATSAAQAVGIYQAFDRLIQEKQTAYAQSLKDVEKHMRRQSGMITRASGPLISPKVQKKAEKRTPISLHSDVILTVGALSFGVYPSTFYDSVILKAEANNVQVRFAVGIQSGKITSGLGMTLGQLQVALASARRTSAIPKALEVSVDEVISNATNAKGGTILRVPRVVASMQTWQTPNSNSVDYVFKSLFEGKIDVGWNLSRINNIKNMWMTHSRTLASRLGKSLPASAVRITAGPDKPSGMHDTNSTDATDPDGSAPSSDSPAQQAKITAEISLPQSRFEYHALEPPIIETPQLRDMGEATPPLEWIGLQRDRLPHVTHQIIIVSLLEMCKEVEDAYERILGSS